MFLFSTPDERRQQLLAGPFPEDWLVSLRDNVALYRLLTEAEQARLRDALRIFIAEKNWEGCRGQAITDEIKVVIAAQACLLALGFENFYFDDVKTILIYPGQFLVNLEEDDARATALLGQAVVNGPVLLSWRNALWDARRLGGTNLVLHEFAHKLGQLFDPHTSVPGHDDPVVERRWQKLLDDEFQRLCHDADFGRDDVLDSYGARNQAEFFAVASESFFLQPRELRRQRPRLYQALSEWYRQDPARRREPNEEENAEAARIEEAFTDYVIDECTAALQLHPDFVEAYGQRASAYCQRGDFEQAVLDYSALIAHQPDDAEVYCDRGVTYRTLGQYDAALADFDRALARAPDFARAHCERGITLAEMGESTPALAAFKQALKCDPDDDVSHLERGRLHHDLGNLDKALRDFTAALRLFPNSAQAYAERAGVHLDRQDYSSASADCSAALEIEPQFPEALTYRALAALEQGDAGRAVADCTEAIRIAPEFAEAFHTRAKAFDMLGEARNAAADRAEAERLEEGVA